MDKLVVGPGDSYNSVSDNGDLYYVSSSEVSDMGSTSDNSSSSADDSFLVGSSASYNSLLSVRSLSSVSAIPSDVSPASDDSSFLMGASSVGSSTSDNSSFFVRSSSVGSASSMDSSSSPDNTLSVTLLGNSEDMLEVMRKSLGISSPVADIASLVGKTPHVVDMLEVGNHVTSSMVRNVDIILFENRSNVSINMPHLSLGGLPEIGGHMVEDGEGLLG